MMKVSDLQIGSIYNFNTLAPHVLGAERKNVILEGIFNYNLAIRQENVDLKARSVQPYLPTSVQNDPKKYTYLYLKNPNNTYEMMAYEWIDANSFVLTDSVSITIRIPMIDASYVKQITDTLTLMGVIGMEVSTSLPTNS